MTVGEREVPWEFDEERCCWFWGGAWVGIGVPSPPEGNAVDAGGPQAPSVTAVLDTGRCSRPQGGAPTVAVPDEALRARWRIGIRASDKVARKRGDSGIPAAAAAASAAATAVAAESPEDAVSVGDGTGAMGGGGRSFTLGSASARGCISGGCCDGGGGGSDGGGGGGGGCEETGGP